MSKPRMLDLYCSAGGATRGYQLAGFHVTGVDLHPQPNYIGDAFVQMDALEVLRQIQAWGGFPGVTGSHRAEPWCTGFEAIHASPPCQAHSSIGKQVRGRDADLEHPDLIPQTRELLIATGLPYVIENVMGAPLINPTMLCGSSFGLDVRRHRLFETNWPLMGPPCQHGWQAPRFRSLDQRIVRRGGKASVIGVHGHLNYPGEKQLREAAMGIDWMSTAELSQAIPPAYCELVGWQLRQYLSTEGRLSPEPVPSKEVATSLAQSPSSTPPESSSSSSS